MSHAQRKALWASAAAATALAAAGISGLPAEAARTPEPPPEMLRALQRDLGLTAPQVRLRLRQEAHARDLGGKAGAATRAAAAGLWFDARTGGLAVAVTTDRDAEAVRAAGAEPRRVARDARELKRITGALEALLVRHRVRGVNSWGTDPRANGVVLQIDRSRADASTERLVARAKALSPGGAGRVHRRRAPAAGRCRPGRGPLEARQRVSLLDRLRRDRHGRAEPALHDLPAG
ncbi:alpha-lytic protease prodomain-containing protein [Spirillospora sp. CA-294931]|uniref:alpha-lytic protease prodomain-containing protein n=1 Tax=Spirillospora sp. CA-294931 TaxID=3240042 RepID=UPI003D8A87B7